MKKLCITLSLILSVCLLFAGCGTVTEGKTAAIRTTPTAEPSSQRTTESATESTTQPTTEFTTQSTTEPATEFTTLATEPTAEATASYTMPEAGGEHNHEFLNGLCVICGESDPDESEITYVLNVKSMKFHYLSCKTLPTDNRKDTTMSREEVINAGYSPCGNCKP